MNVEEFRDYCLSLPVVTEKMPFPTVNDPYSRDVLCFYAGPKWFIFMFVFSPRHTSKLVCSRLIENVLLCEHRGV